MLQNFEQWNEAAQKVAGMVLIVFALCACLVLQLLFSFISNVKEHDAQTKENANWVKSQPITAQEEKQKVKSFWSLKLTFEEGGEDE